MFDVYRQTPSWPDQRESFHHPSCRGIADKGAPGSTGQSILPIHAHLRLEVREASLCVAGVMHDVLPCAMDFSAFLALIILHYSGNFFGFFNY